MLEVWRKSEVMHMYVRGMKKVRGHAYVCERYEEGLWSCICMLEVWRKSEVMYMYVRGMKKVSGHVYVC